MQFQSIDDLERQVAVAELEVLAIEAAHLAGTVDSAIALVRNDRGSERTVAELEVLRGRMIFLLERLTRLLN